MKIAVIGSGISGLASALILNKNHHVTLFESESKLGGHANTIYTKNQNEKSIPIDTGFLVYNEITYPNFCALLKYLNVESCPSDMTLSVQIENGIQWAGTNLQTIFAQKKNLFKKDFILMLLNILKFHKHASENLELSKQNKWTLADLIQYRGYSKSFIEWYLIPMTGAIWSMSFNDVLLFPAQTFLQFCLNHRLLQIQNRPIWRTIKNGSINYVNKIALQLKDVRLNQKINKISYQDNKVLVHSETAVEVFDKVIIATSAPIAKKLIQNDFINEAKILSAASTSENKIVLHQDQNLMPSDKKIWSAWNVKATDSKNFSSPVQLTYYANKLQPLEDKQDYFISLNSNQNIRNEIFKTTYFHPQFNQQMIEIQKQLPTIQGLHGVYFVGAWTRYGFHEDGIFSAVEVCKLLKESPPWIN